jgi:hypothetical protein
MGAWGYGVRNTEYGVCWPLLHPVLPTECGVFCSCLLICSKYYSVIATEYSVRNRQLYSSFQQYSKPVLRSQPSLSNHHSLFIELRYHWTRLLWGFYTFLYTTVVPRPLLIGDERLYKNHSERTDAAGITQWRYVSRIGDSLCGVLLI